ncbi:MAG TPA: DNA replication/repair protein RecF [Steroidobacteraceae bacterium]|jgi:DNA replication and repair protein RecF|nr:DNA replication/repair protein RecF [Steroidobacteraceae bacterium]
MSFTQLAIANVRCIEQAELDIPGGLTLVWGGNGSGKTSLLESIFLLGRGRSFRTRNTHRLIRRGQNHLRVTGRVNGPAGVPMTIGLEMTATAEARSGSAITARVSGRTVQSLAELSQIFPVQVIEPGVHRLVEEGGYRRRRWMDWAVFHVEPPFIDLWLRYTRALKQRNAALKADPSQAPIWNPELARLGESIAESRRRLLEALDPYWQDAVRTLCGLPVELHYHRGWAHDHTLLDALAAARVRDEAHHLTHVGPHRADVAVRLHGRPAREVLSRGQQKLVAVAMTLAQLRFLQATTSTTPTLLLDDPAAELDGEHLERFIAQVSVLRCQLVVTSLHSESRLFGSPERAFHMDQGRVEPV